MYVSNQLPALTGKKVIIAIGEENHARLRIGLNFITKIKCRGGGGEKGRKLVLMERS